MTKRNIKPSKFSYPLGEEGEPSKEDIDSEPVSDSNIEGLSQEDSGEPISVTPQNSVSQNEIGEYNSLGGSGDSTMKIITKIDSPIDIKQVFWSFVTKDISMSNISEKDFKYILTNLKLRLYSFIQKYPIEEWDNIKFAEYDYKIEPQIRDGKIVIDESGQIVYIQKKYVKNSWDFSELLLDLEEFVYHQLTRGRQGFTFRRLTETFQVSEVNSGSKEPVRPKGWKLW